MLSRCPFFDDLDEIFGDKAKFDPPHLSDSSSSVIQEAQDSEQVVVDEDDQTEQEDVDEPELILSRKKSSPSVLGKRPHKVDSGIAALAETTKLRMDVQKGELDLAREKCADEKRRKDNQEQIDLLKFENEKLVQTKKLELEEMKIRNEFEIAKFKIEQECKLKLELAKISGPVN